MTLEFTDANFDTDVLKSTLPVLVDFWAPWCGPCRMLTPIIEELSKEYEGKYKIGKVNVDDNSNVAAKYGIRSIPAIFIFKNGEIVEQIIGVQSKQKLIDSLNKYL